MTEEPKTRIEIPVVDAWACLVSGMDEPDALGSYIALGGGMFGQPGKWFKVSIPAAENLAHELSGLVKEARAARERPLGPTLALEAAAKELLSWYGPFNPTKHPPEINGAWLRLKEAVGA